MHLTIEQLMEKHFGDYFCHAENVYGSTTRLVSLKSKRLPRTTPNIAECCIEEGVSTNCMKACGYFLDIDIVKDRSECLIDLDKLMKCASDNIDHTTCCTQAHIPRRCMNWCNGNAIIDTDKSLCALQYAPMIIECHQMDRDRLPSAPQHLHFRQTGISSALIMWTSMLDDKSDRIDGYRVYWQPLADNQSDFLQQHSPQTHINGGDPFYVDTMDTQADVAELQLDTLYVFTVKAANKFGS